MFKHVRLAERWLSRFFILFAILIATSIPAAAGVAITGSSPTSFSGPGQTITFTFVLSGENAVVESMQLESMNKPLSGLSCSPDFPIDVNNSTTCTATYTTTSSDLTDIFEYGSYSLTTNGGPRSGNIDGQVKVTYSAAPTANPVSATVASNSTNNPITLDITGAVATSVAIGSPPAHGTAVATGTSITYSPASGYSGTDSFTYTASNAAGTSAPATVTVTVTAPPLKDFNFTTGFDTPLVFNVVNSGVSNYFLVTAPTDGTIVLNADGSGTYTPNREFSGSDEFLYGTGTYGSNTGTVRITVTPPTITLSPSALPNATSGVSYSESLTASGGKGPYTFAYASGAMVPGLTLAANGTLSGTPTEAGTFTFNVVATDSSGGSGPFSSSPTAVSVTVTPNAPTITSIVPNNGPPFGGTIVTITGTNPIGATSVFIGSTPATNVTVVSATQITAATPAGSTGASAPRPSS